MRDIEDIMSKKIVTVDSYATVEDAAKELKKHEIGSLIVTQEKRTVGIVTERDIAYKYVASQKEISRSKDVRVKDIMTSTLITQSLDDNLRIMDIIILMDEQKIKHVCITKKGKIVGMLADRDIFRELSGTYLNSYKKIGKIKEMIRLKKQKELQSKKR